MSQQVYTTSSLGGYYAVPQLTNEIRNIAQPLMGLRKHVRIEPRAGRGAGDTIYFDKNLNPASNGGTISETGTIPKTTFTITQGSLTMTEYGVAIPYTSKLQTLGQISVDSSIREVLANSIAKVLDSAAGTAFKTTDYKVQIISTSSTTFNSASSAPGAAAANMSDKNVRDIIDEMKKINIPKNKKTGLYTCVGATNAIRGLWDFFESKAAYTTLEEVRKGTVGVYYGCAFEEETNQLSNVLNTYYGEALFFGDDAVLEGIAIPEEIRMDAPKDHGRDLSLAWYYLGGFVKVWDFSTDGDSRILHVTTS